MAAARSIVSRSRHRRKLGHQPVALNLTAMMDILTIILVFLLKSYSVSTNSFTSVSGIQLPYSVSPDSPPDSLQIIVTPEGLTFENQRIVDFVQTEAAVGADQASYAFKPTDLDEGGRRIVPLYDALVKARDQSEILRAKSSARDANGQPLPFDGILAIQADKRVEYDTVRRIMYTAATADFRIFRFLAMKREI
jgi:biopolymer transport protein ExbD